MSYMCLWKCKNFLFTCFIPLWSKAVLYSSNKQEKENLTLAPFSPTPRSEKSKAYYFQNTHSQGRPQVRLPRKTLWARNSWNITAPTHAHCAFTRPHKNRYIGQRPEAEAVEIRLTHVIIKKNREGGTGGCTGPHWPTTNSSVFKVQILRREREGRLAAGKENRLAADASLWNFTWTNWVSYQNIPTSWTFR